MKFMLDSETIVPPKGLSRKEIKEFIISKSFKKPPTDGTPQAKSCLNNVQGD